VAVYLSKKVLISVTVLVLIEIGLGSPLFELMDKA